MTRPTGPDGPRTARLHVRCTPDDLAAYQAAAGRAGVSVGEWVRKRLSAGDGDVCRFCGHERLPYQPGMTCGNPDPRVCSACGRS